MPRCRHEQKPLVRKCTCRQHQFPNARVYARVRRFSFFCLHLFTLRLYLTENKHLACEGFTIHRKTAYLTMAQRLRCEDSHLHLDTPFEQWVTRPKRRRKLPRDTAAWRVKEASRKAHPLAFTHNTLCTKSLQRILTRIHKVTSSRINHLLSIDWKRKSTR